MVKSPCVKICVLDHEDICVGCKRTKSDVRDWMKYTEEEQLMSIDRANERKIKEDLDHNNRYV